MHRGGRSGRIGLVTDATSNRWLAETGGTRGPEYAARFAALAEAGQDVHGEADFCDRLLAPGSRVVDGGCGTGRVGAELARRGHHVVGVDVDASMLAEARRLGPATTWLEADLLDVGPDQVGAPVDLVVLAGNVVVYLTPGTEPALPPHLATWLRPGGMLVAGFAADRHVTPRDWDGWCAAGGLEHVASHAGWDGTPLDEAAAPAYLVSVHRRRS
jgi:SAM-dependent methyltransferase